MYQVIRLSSIALTAAIIMSCQNDTSSTTSTDIPYVKVLTVGSHSSMQQNIAYPGKTKAAEEVNVAFRVSGPIIHTYVKEGDYVRQGQLLAEMDPRDYRNQLSATQAEYQQVKADAERIMAIYEEGNTTASNYDKARFGLQQITEKLHNHQNMLSDTKLYAPFSGYISQKIHDQGETVSAGMPIYSMFSSGNVEIEINLPASDYANRSQFVNHYCTFDILPDEKFPLVVSSVSQAANANQLYAVKLKISGDYDKSKITPGMTAMVYMERGDEPVKSLTIPSTALFNDHQDAMVYVFTADKDTLGHTAGKGKVSRRKVIVKSLNTNGDCVISDGLSEGEVIVTAGIHLLHEGQEVKQLPRSSESNVGGLL